MVDLLVWRLVQCRGQQATPQRDPGPGQVGVAGLVDLRQPGELLAGLSGPRGVGDPALRHGADRVLGRHRRWLARPPGDDRGVGQHERHDDAVALHGELAVEPQDEHLAGAGVTAHPDLGVEPVDAALRALDDDDDPARVLVAGTVGGVDGLLGIELNCVGWCAGTVEFTSEPIPEYYTSNRVSHQYIYRCRMPKR